MRQILWIPAAAMSLALAPLPGVAWRPDVMIPLATHVDETYKLVVSPATATIEAGRYLSLTAVVTSESGRTLRRTIRWTSSDPAVATVASDGRVKGLSAGTATITGSALSGRAVGSSRITVTEPSGTATTLSTPTAPTSVAAFGDDFESGTLGAWQDGYNATRHRVITDASLARSGSRLLEVTYASGGNGGFLTRFFMPGYDSVRVSYWVRFPQDWKGTTMLVGLYGSRLDNQWSAFGKAGRKPTGTDFAIAFLTNEGTTAPGATSFSTYFPEMLASSDGKYWGDTGAGRATYTDPRVMSLGEWHRVELWMKLNTPGQKDGAQRFWIDGVLKGEWTGLRFRDTDQIRINSVQLPFAGSASIPAGQKLYIDDLQVTGNAPAESAGGPVVPPPPPPPPAPAPVASVDVSPASLTLLVDSSRTLSVTLRDSTGTALEGRTVSWSTSASGIATVSTAGVARAIAPGSATITATSEGRSATASITVTPPPVASVSISPASATLDIGGTQAFSATLRDAAGATLTGRTVTWSSSNTLVTTVASSGTATAVAAGSATITATSEGRSATATVTVNAPPPPPPPPSSALFSDDFESGSLGTWEDGYNPTHHRVITDAALARSGTRLLEVSYLQGGNGGFLTRFFMPGYDSLKVSYWVRFPTNWQGSTKLVGIYGSRIDNQWSAFGKAGQRPNGTDYAASFLTNEPGPVPGVTHFYSYFPEMAADNGMYWGDLGIGRASYTGSRVMSLGAWHRVEFWVKLNTPGQSNGAQRFWVDGVLQGEWTGIRFRDTDQIRLNALQLTFDRGGSPSTAAQKLYVDDVRVIANAPSGSEGTVTPPPPPPPAPVASVSVSPASGSIVAGGTTQLSATLRDASGNVLTGRSITWSSTSPAIATVSSSGTVTGLQAGSTTIRATSDGQTGTASITVTAPAPAAVASVTLAPSSLSLQVGQTATVAATLRSSGGTVLTGRAIAWSSTNTSVATVSSSGTVTAVGAGSATIRATSEGITGSASVAVTAPPPPPPPPTGSMAFTNAPAGLNVATDADWTSWPSGWVNERASTTGLARLATDGTAPVSPSGVLEEFYPAGMSGGTAPGNVIFTGTNGASEVFVGFWFKMSPNFQGHSSGVNKLVNIWTPFDIHWLRVNSWSQYDNDGSRQNGPFYLVATNRSSPYDLLQNQVQTMIPIVPGQWHKVEWHLTTAGAAPGNGRVRWWLDGVLVGDYSNLSSTMGSAFSEFQISPTWGGNGDTMGADSYMRFDQVFISRR